MMNGGSPIGKKLYASWKKIIEDHLNLSIQKEVSEIGGNTNRNY